MKSKTAEEIARSVDADPEDVFHLLRHLASNDARIKVAAGDEAADDRFSSRRIGVIVKLWRTNLRKLQPTL